MIRGFGRETFSTYCQTLNGCDVCIDISSRQCRTWIFFSICGHFLVSRICDAGWTERCFKCARFVHSLLDTIKSVVVLRHQDR